MRRRMAARGSLAIFPLLAVLACGGPDAAPSADPSVLGARLARCASGAVPEAVGLSADNAPLTVTVAGGEIAAALAPATTISPGEETKTRGVSFLIGTPRTSGGNLVADVTVRNLTDCAARVSRARATIVRDAEPSSESAIRFGQADSAVIEPGEEAKGSFSVPLTGDGTYALDATANGEIAPVR